MRVVERQGATNAVSIIENGRASRITELAQGWMPDGTAPDTVRLSGDRANRVQVVNRVVEHLEARRPLQKRPLLPWLAVDDSQLDVGELSEGTAPDEIAKRDHIRAEAQLEVHGGYQLSLTAHGENLPGAVEIDAERFLQEHRRPSRQTAEDAQRLISWHRNVEHRVSNSSSLRKAGIHRPDRCLAGRRAGRVRGDVEDAGDREPETRVSWQVGRTNDRAGPDDHDWPGVGRQGPRLGAVPASINHRTTAPRPLRRNTGSMRAHESPDGAPGTGSWRDLISCSHWATSGLDAT